MLLCVSVWGGKWDKNAVNKYITGKSCKYSISAILEMSILTARKMYMGLQPNGPILSLTRMEWHQCSHCLHCMLWAGRRPCHGRNVSKIMLTLLLCSMTPNIAYLDLCQPFDVSLRWPREAGQVQKLA